MAESTSVFNTPQLWINTYLQENLATLVKKQSRGDMVTDLTTSQGIGVPFFPSRPTSIDEITEQWVVLNTDEAVGPTRYPYAGVMCTWDRLVRMRRSPFPHIKQEQLLYYFYATQENVTETMVQVQEAVLRLMDREDETAEEINRWAEGKTIDGMTNKFYFHRFKVYQLEEVRDIIDFGTARTYGGNKIIIDFEYHQDDSIVKRSL
jgi:hypothetical protein